MVGPGCCGSVDTNLDDSRMLWDLPLLVVIEEMVERSKEMLLC